MPLSTKNFVAGQKLWVVPLQRYFGSAREAVVSSVGRKWVGVDDDRYRFDPSICYRDAMLLDGKGSTSPASVYVSREVAERSHEITMLWGRLQRRIRDEGLVPDGVGADEIRQACALLKLDLEQGGGGRK